MRRTRVYFYHIIKEHCGLMFKKMILHLNIVIIYFIAFMDMSNMKSLNVSIRLNRFSLNLHSQENDFLETFGFRKCLCLLLGFALRCKRLFYSFSSICHDKTVDIAHSKTKISWKNKTQYYEYFLIYSTCSYIKT